MQKNKDLIKLTPKLKCFFQFNSNAHPPPPLSGPLLRRRVYVNFVIISGLFGVVEPICDFLLFFVYMCCR